MPRRSPQPPEEPPSAPTPADLLSAVQHGTHQEGLEAIRDRLARSIEIAIGDVKRSEEWADVDAGEKLAALALGQIAGLSKQLRETLAELAEIAPAAVDEVDEIAKRRTARLAAAAVSPRPTRKVVGGTGDDRPSRKRGAAAGRTPAARPPRSTRGGS